MKMGDGQKNSFVFYRSYLTAAARMTDDQRIKFFDALIAYGLDKTPITETGDVVIDIAFDFVVPLLDANHKNYENGKKGGRPKKENPTKTQTKPNNNHHKTHSKGNDNVNVNVNDNVNDNGKENIKEKNKPSASSFSEKMAEPEDDGDGYMSPEEALRRANSSET